MKHTCAQKKNGSFIGYRCSKNRNCLKSHPVAPPWENLFSVWLRPLNKNVIAALFKCPNLQITKTSVSHRNGWMGYNVLTEKSNLWWPKTASVCFIPIILNASLYFATSHLHKCPRRPNKFMESEVRRVLAFPGSWGCLGRAVRLWMLQCCYLSLDACQTEERYLVTSHWAACFRLLYLKVYKVCIKPPCLILWSLPQWLCLQIYISMESFLFKSPQKGSRLGLEYARGCKTALHGKSSSEWRSECVCQNRSTQGRCR